MTEKIADLCSQQCDALSAVCSALKPNESEELLQQLDPAWLLNVEQQNITHTFTFKNYYKTIAFVNVIAQIAHQQDHHPDLLVGYNRCTVTYSTHSVGGLSINDFICAAKINASQKL
jgi:4a-hydroxytetrahydrobiopterin dehydratase